LNDVTLPATKRGCHRQKPIYDAPVPHNPAWKER
jgi:hypothetical protein